MPTIIKAQTPADLLAFAPHLLGYLPTRSVVMMLFDGNRTCGALRMDLPDDTSPTTLKRFANVALGTISKVPDVRAIVPIIFTDQPFGDDSLIPHHPLFEVLARRSRHMGFPLKEALCRAADGWASYLDKVTPRGGHPLSDVLDSEVVDMVPENHRASAGDQLSEAAIVEVDRRAADLTDAFISATKSARELLSVRPDFRVEPWDLDDIPEYLELALTMTDEEIAVHGRVLLFGLQAPPMRDQAMLQWATSLDTGARLFREIESAQGDPSAVDPELGNLMLGIGPRPELERVERAIHVLRTLLTQANPEYRPAPLCMLAWLSWAIGHTTHAGAYVAQAQAIDPDYSMAELLRRIVDSGRLPEWAFQRG